MSIPKEVVRCGDHWYVDQATGLPKKLAVTSEMVNYWCDQGNKMIECGLSIPVPVEHDPEAVPKTAAERAAWRTLNNAGWVEKYEKRKVTNDDGTEVDALYSTLDIQDEELVKKLPRTIRWTSPWINTFTDGQNREWPGVITHLALTTRPRISQQEPFKDINVAMSFAASLAPQQVRPGQGGFSLSRAGLLKSKDGKIRPAYPVAFSLYSGARLAAEDIPDEEPRKKKNQPPEKKGGEPSVAPTTDASEGISNPADPANPAANPAGPVEPSLVDGDGDISVYTVLADLLHTVGIEMPEGTTKENFAQRLYQAAMEKVKTGGDTADPLKPDAAKPPGNPNPGGPSAPVIQEQQPMFMSLEEVSKISDPQLKRMATIALSLQENELTRRKTERQLRVERLARRLPAIARDALLARLADPGAAFSLTAEGKVIDPMDATLSLLEASIPNLPELLMAPGALLSEQPHPTDGSGGMSEQRHKEVIEEIQRNTGLPDLPRKAG